MFLVFHEDAVLPVELVFLPQQVACEYSSELDIERSPWQQVLVEANFLSASCSSKARNLQIEEVLGRVVVELAAQVTLAIFDLNEGVLSLTRVSALKRVEKLAYTLLKVDIGGKRNDLDVHVRGFFKLERTVALKHEIVHVFRVQDVVEQEVAKLNEFFLDLVIQFERVGDVAFGHNEEVVVADGPFGQGDVEMF